MDPDDKALIPQPSTALEITRPKTHPVIARMTRDVLAQVRETGVSQARFRIGEYSLREPDYRQVLLWAEALGMAPEEVMRRLAKGRWELKKSESLPPIAFGLEDGAFVSLAWDFATLPISPDTWMVGLRLRELAFKGQWPDEATPLAPRLPKLQRLVCRSIYLGMLQLSGVPGLTELSCEYNHLTELDLLDLSPVPGLTRLRCDENLHILNAPADLSITRW